MKNLTVSRISIIATFVSLLASASSIYAQGAWSSQSSEGFTARWAAAAGEVDDKIYVAGGLNNGLGGTINTLEVFDPYTNTWSTPVTSGTFSARRSATAVTVNGKIYVMGGTGVSGTVIVNTLEVFDPATNSWTTPTTTGTFTARASCSSAIVDGKIYVAGGVGVGSKSISTLEVFDPLLNTWSAPAVTGTFTPRHGLASCVVDGKIYAFGGANETGILNTVEIFDPLTNAWSTPSTTGSFTARRGLTASLLGGKIYVIGGYDGLPGVPGNYLNTIEVFDPTANVWTTPISAGTFTARYGHTASVVGGKIYALSGQTATATSTNISEVFTPENSSVSTGTDPRALALSPNPTNGIVTVHAQEQGDVHLEVANMLGERVLAMTQPTSDFTFDLSGFPAGAYIVKLSIAGRVTTKMLIKE